MNTKIAAMNRIADMPPTNTTARASQSNHHVRLRWSSVVAQA
jgi:hypothetical protein